MFDELKGELPEIFLDLLNVLDRIKLILKDYGELKKELAKTRTELSILKIEVAYLKKKQADFEELLNLDSEEKD